MRLADQWDDLRSELPENWESARLTLTTEQPGDMERATAVLAPLNPGRIGDELTFEVRRAGAQAGPQAATRLFSRLDDGRVWCTLRLADAGLVEREPETAEAYGSAAQAWDEALEPLPADWSDLLCELEVDSSDHLPRVALLCAPLNPARVPGSMAFSFRCARQAGYGASPGMARRCLERLDEEQIPARVTVLRALSESGLESTQGPTFVVGGRVL